MIGTIFQEEILEGWMVLYIDDIIIYSETLEDHMQYIDRVLSKCTPINVNGSLKKCNFGQQQLLALGNLVSGLSLAINKNKVAAVLQNQYQGTLRYSIPFYFTRIKLIVPHKSSNYSLQADLHSNFTPKG
ncbi:hypothetical protein O181_077972 [Austropuccinia psidii MF-1]|uniref:Reverse transcriptase domain-containing protein n=1 Tax=Austropuccinia psidii MF-1 TaxID=1389203 RepID=A0A9Q3IF63_9BASI|nr:hypothetical protein [Austropuccinia psidii MF-1]